MRVDIEPGQGRCDIVFDVRARLELNGREIHPDNPRSDAETAPRAKLPASFGKNPFAQSHYDARLLCDRDEFCCANETARRMLPTQQSLDSDNPTRRKLDFRLIIKL